MTLSQWLKATKDSFIDRIGLNREALFAEFDRLAAKLGIVEGDELTDAFVKQAKAIYAAYIEQVRGNIIDVSFVELLNLMNTGRVPKRKRRVGASTA